MSEKEKEKKDTLNEILNTFKLTVGKIIDSFNEIDKELETRKIMTSIQKDEFFLKCLHMLV
jgi:hypothetical protein